MPATTPTVLARVMDAIAENLATVTVVGGAAQLFGGDGTPANWDTPAGPHQRPTRVYLQGEPIPDGGPFPIAVIRLEDESFDELEQTTKWGHVLPYTIEVIFDLNPTTEPDAHPTLRHIHTNLIRQVKDRFALEAGGRYLPLAGYGNTVTDTAYVGGGAQLTPLDVDAEGDAGSARYSFVLQFRAIYRHVPGDSTTQA